MLHLADLCIQNYESTSSSIVKSSYMLTIDSSGSIVYSEYIDSACTMYSGNFSSIPTGDCQYSGDESYFFASVSAVTKPVLLPGMYYVGYESMSDCQNEVDRPAAYVLEYPADQCTPVGGGMYFYGLCQASGNLSFSVYNDPACSGTAVSTGIKAIPGPPNHGCFSRLSLDSEYESSDSASNWVRFYCGTNQAFAGMDSPTAMPALAPTLAPATVVVNNFTGYLKQEFFTDSACAHPYKTTFTSSGRCVDTSANQYNSANLSTVTQFTLSESQVVKDIRYYSGLGCEEFAFQETASTTSTTCSLFPYISEGGDQRTDLYAIQSFVVGTATPTVPFVGIVSSR